MCKVSGFSAIEHVRHTHTARCGARGEGGGGGNGKLRERSFQYTLESGDGVVSALSTEETVQGQGEGNG